jgi:hypothetical protein
MKALVDTTPVKGWRGLPELCTVAQLAENFRCSRSTIYRNIYREEVGKDGMWADKVNGRWRIPRIEAAHWFHRPMREAMTTFIMKFCGNGGRPNSPHVNVPFVPGRCQWGRAKNIGEGIDTGKSN